MGLNIALSPNLIDSSHVDFHKDSESGLDSKITFGTEESYDQTIVELQINSRVRFTLKASRVITSKAFKVRFKKPGTLYSRVVQLVFTVQRFVVSSAGMKSAIAVGHSAGSRGGQTHPTGRGHVGGGRCERSI